MRILWRTLPKLALPAAIGLGIAYMGTGFVPRPAPNLRPPEELTALGQAYDEASPVRAILERNVLQLETPVFAPLGQMPAPVPTPAGPASAPAASAAQSASVQSSPAQAAFAPVDPSLSAPPAPSATEPLSGGPSVVGRIAPPLPAGQAASAGPATSAGASASAGATASSGMAASGTQAFAPAQGGQAQKPAPPKPDAPKPDAPKPDVPKTPAPSPAPSLAGIRLVGVIAGGDKPLAMLSVDGAALSLGLGATVRGWTLIAVEPGQVVLRSGEHVRRLGLNAGGTKP